MGPANAAGPAAPDLSAPAPADKAALRARLEAGEWLVDLRTRTAFAAGHVPGTLNFGIDGQLATYLGWLIPWGTPLTLLGETAGAGRRGAARAGPDRHRPPRRRGHRHRRSSGPTSRWAGSSGPRSPTWPRSGTTAPWPSWTCAAPPEYDESHLEGAVSIPLHELLGRLGEVPAGEVWVHCAGGYRASIAASILAAPAAGWWPWTTPTPRRRGRRAADGRERPGRRVSALAIPLGLLIGLSLGALGGGGSILTVPALVYVLGQSPVAGDHRVAGHRRDHLADRDGRPRPGRPGPRGPGPALRRPRAWPGPGTARACRPASPRPSCSRRSRC